MANEYRDFKTFHAEEQKLDIALNAANGGSRDAPVRGAAASLYVDPATLNYRDYLLNDPNVQTNELVTVLGTGLGTKNTQVNHLISNLEVLVNDMGKRNIMIGLDLVPPQASYSGTNAALYTQIKTTGEKVRTMAQIINSNNFGAMYTEIKTSENARLTSVNAEQKALCNALIDVQGNFVKIQYTNQAQDAQTAFNNVLSGNEGGYLAANLAGKNFRQFYADLKANGGN
jgi:hypothetical protein